MKCFNDSESRSFICQDLSLIYSQTKLIVWDMSLMTMAYMQNQIKCGESIHKGKRLIEVIIDHPHNIIGYFGQFKTAQYIRRYFWWQSMSHNIESYCKSCGICTTSKDANSKPTGLLHSLPIPDRPWQSIGLDFMGPLPKSNNFDYLLVIID